MNNGRVDGARTVTQEIEERMDFLDEMHEKEVFSYDVQIRSELSTVL